MGNALNLFHKRDALVVQVRTDTGLIGRGESGNQPHAAAAFIRTRLAGLILGKSPLEIGRHFQAMCGAVGYDRRGAAMMAISLAPVEVSPREIAPDPLGRAPRSFFNRVLHLRHGLWICERRQISGFLPADDRTDDAAHDFHVPRLWQIVNQEYQSWPEGYSHAFDHRVRKSLLQFGASHDTRHGNACARYRRALDIVGYADNGRFG